MKKIISSMALLFSLFAQAQDEKVTYEITGQGGYSIYPLWNVGGQGKVVFKPLRNGRQITASICYDHFKGKSSGEYGDYNYKYSTLLLSAGYRRNYNNIFIEWFWGGGVIYDGSSEPYGSSETYSAGAFLIGIEPGIRAKRLVISTPIRIMDNTDIIFDTSYWLNFSLRAGVRL